MTPILAEIADKEPSLTIVWLLAALLSALCCALCRWRRRAAFIALPLALGWAFACISELRDPFVGPAIGSELGRSYVTQSYLASVLPLLFSLYPLVRRAHQFA